MSIEGSTQNVPRNFALHSPCDSNFCFECVQGTLDDLLSRVDELNSIKNRHAPKKSRQTFTKLKLFTPVHRRTRSDEVLAQKTFRSNDASTSGLPLNNQPVFDETSRKFDQILIQASLKQAEELTKFIQQREYETNLELERENAHFLLSELLIATIEQMKWRNVLCRAPPVAEQRFTAPHLRHPHFYVVPSHPEAAASSSVDGLNMSALNGQSTISTTMSDELNRTVGDFSESPSGSCTDVNVAPSVSENSDGGVTDTGYETSVLSFNRKDELIPEQTLETSAEVVAMDLLKKFSRKHFPTQANDVQWLVSYKDAPQLLLPIPSSQAVAPDDMYADGTDKKLNLRGTFDWAPPRAQVIFQLQTPQKLKVLLAAQGFRCPGCGRKIEPNYYARLRYCAYLGKAFCQCCHRGETTQIPAHILHKWNFKRYPVSDFALRFLETNFESPFFNASVINPSLCANVKGVKSAIEKRRQLRFMYDYVRTCRLAKDVVTKDGNLLQLFERLPSHFVMDENVFSLKDFVAIKDGVFEKSFEAALNWSKYHILSCQFCMAKGFYCEACLKKDVLFPFQTDVIRRCDLCGSCFHKKCVKRNFDCPKCRRMKTRQEVVLESVED